MPTLQDICTNPEVVDDIGNLRSHWCKINPLMSNLINRLATLRALTSRFRTALEGCDPAKLPIGLQVFPRGACGDVSLLLGKYLHENGEAGIEYVSGKNGDQTHGWLELNGIIVDITADQFDSIIESVVVTTCSTWHQKFTGQSRRRFNIEDVDTCPSLSVAYNEILQSL
jgi:hypothetical protein